MILVTKMCVCLCVCGWVFSSHSFWTSSSLDAPAGVTQEEGRTGFLIHLPSEVRALITTMERVMVGFREAREKGTMAFVECLGVSQEDTMEGPLWRETLGRSLGMHDAAELVGGMCHGNACRQETTRLHAISCTKTGWISLTHNRMLHQGLARSLRKSKVQFLVEDS